LTPSGKIALGDAKSGPSHAIFSRDGATALVTRDGDSKISILAVDGSKVEYTKNDLVGGLRPYQGGDVALVGNVGAGTEGDSVSVIDMRAKPIRVAGTTGVGQAPEGLKVSPDGAYVAVTVTNGSNRPKTAPQFNDYGLLKIYRISGTDIMPVTEAKIGHWCQGIAWSRDAKTILAQCMVENEIATFTFDGKTLTKTAPIAMKVSPGGSEPPSRSCCPSLNARQRPRPLPCASASPRARQQRRRQSSSWRDTSFRPAGNPIHATGSPRHDR
jgi:DNA-binding beta-propeller fold protein YncE